MSDGAPKWFQDFIQDEWMDVKEYIAANSVRMEQNSKDIEDNTGDIESLKKTKYVAIGTGLLATGEGIWLAIKTFFTEV